jgi:hypothetical protein
MTGIVAKFARIRFVFAAAAFAATWGGAQRAEAQGLVYVEGVDQLGGAQQNIFRADGGDINTALDPNQLANGSVPGNNLWNYRDEGVPDPTGTFATIYESIQEDSPELRQQISGLTANTMYDVYVAYWSDGANWGVRAGFTSNPNTNTLFNVTGANFGTAGTLAGSGAWTTPPADNPDDDPDNPSPFVNITDLDVVDGPETTQTMYLGFVGATTSNASGQISVFIDDQANTTDGNLRSWLDGLAYVPAGTQVFVTATLNRDTGNLVINNPTGVTYNIASYSLASAGGSMIAAQWDSIADGGNTTITEANPWATTSTTAALLSEAETPAVNGAQLVATTGAFNVGNVWARTPIQDVQITLNLTNGSSITVAPTYTGTAIANGDFNADTFINIADFTILKTNMHSNVSALTFAQSYVLGDMSRDSIINSTDFIAFRTAYDAANGAGSFVAMVNGIPEPSSAALAALGLGMLRATRRRRRAVSHAPVKIAAVSARRIRRSFVIVACLAMSGLTSSSAWAQTVIPITGWFATGNLDGHTVPVTNPNSNTFSVGDGTPANADNATVFAAFQPVTFANGQEVVLRGRVQLVGIPITGDAFRFGMFDGGAFTAPYNPSIEPLVSNVPASRSQFDATTMTNGWLGFLASASSGGGNAALEARNPASTQNTQFISNAGGGDVYQVAGLGPATETWNHDNNPATPEIAKTQTPNNRVIRLSTAPSVGNFDADTYDFTMTIGRFGFENTMSARLVSRTFAGDLDADQDVDGNDFLLLQRQATVTAAGMNAFRANFGSGTPDYVTNLSATLSPDQDTLPTMITNEIDRIGFLLSNGMDTAQANFSNVELEIRQIQSLILDVNTNTGAVSVRNAAGVPFDITYYEITSTNGNLNAGGWVSLDDGEGGDLDGVGWDELGTGTANVLSEGNLTGSRLVNNGQSFSLGNAFNTATLLGNRDTNFRFATVDGTLIRGVVNYNTTSSAGAVPEPGSLALAALALVGVCGARRRKA